MPASPARIAAFDILLRVERDHAYAAELFNSGIYDHLSSPDHRLAMDLVNGVQRWRALLDTKIASVSTVQLAKLDLEVLTALRLAAYQLTFLDRVPSRAAVNESVELVKRARKRSAVPFVNAVLRKLSGAQNDPSTSTIDGATTHLAESFSHPRWLVDRWIREFGTDVARTICEYDQQVPGVSVRLNGSSSENRTLENQLAEDGIRLAPGRLLTSTRHVLAGDITSTSAFRKGLVSIQDEGSQLVAFLVGKASRILDCCAAPGGKTRILAQRNPNGNVLAVELHPHRARLLTKLVPMSNVEVITADVRNLPIDAFFERVLVDVPCSGTGTLARNPEIKWRLTPRRPLGFPAAASSDSTIGDEPRGSGRKVSLFNLLVGARGEHRCD